MFKKMKCVVSVLALTAVIIGLSTASEAKKASHVEGVININEATVEELAMLPGIGPSKAQAIIDYRDTQKFTTVEDLTKVRGIGEKLFNEIQAYLTIEGPTTAKQVAAPSLDS